MDSSTNTTKIWSILLFVLGVAVVILSTRILWERSQVTEISTARDFSELSLEQLSQEADVIVNATLSEPSYRVSERDDSNEQIVLGSFEVNTQDVLEGELNQSASLEVFGGTADTEQGQTIKHTANSAPNLEPDTEYVLFLRENAAEDDSVYRLVAGKRGVYDVEGDRLVPRTANAETIRMSDLE